MSRRRSTVHTNMLQVWVAGTLEESLRRLMQEKCVSSMETYIREVLECHVSDQRGGQRVRLELADLVRSTEGSA